MTSDPTSVACNVSVEQVLLILTGIQQVFEPLVFVVIPWPETVECFRWLFSIVTCWLLEEFVCILVVLCIVATKQEIKVDKCVF